MDTFKDQVQLDAQANAEYWNHSRQALVARLEALHICEPPLAVIRR